MYYVLVSNADTVSEVPIRYVNAELLVLNETVTLGERAVTGLRSLSSGDQIKTDNTGRAIIKSGPQLITSLGENSELVFSTESNLKNTKFDLVVGKLWSRLERALEQDEVYEVYTPTLAAAVRGTAFGTEVSSVVDRIIVAEGEVLVTARQTEESILVSSGNAVAVVEGKLTVTPLTAVDYDAWWQEHTDPAWKWGGSPEITLVTANREGFFLGHPGLITVEGTGFNQVIRLEIDGEPIRFVPVSDKLVRVPLTALTSVREDSEAYLYFVGGRVSANEIFVGSEAEVRANLLW